MNVGDGLARWKLWRRAKKRPKTLKLVWHRTKQTNTHVKAVKPGPDVIQRMRAGKPRFGSARLQDALLQDGLLQDKTPVPMPSWTDLNRPSTHTAQAVALRYWPQGARRPGGRDRHGIGDAGLTSGVVTPNARGQERELETPDQKPFKNAHRRCWCAPAKSRDSHIAPARSPGFRSSARACGQ